MKKVLLTATLLIASLVQAQQSSADIIMAGVKQRDAERAALQKEKYDKAAIFDHPNKDYIISLEKLDESGARKFADEVANNSKTKWEFLKVKEDDKNQYYRVIYVDASYPAELKEKIKKGIELCDNCLKVDFSLYFEGENKDLEIKGFKMYRFREVSGKYLDLFPIWQKVFRPDVTLENTVNDYRSQELVQKTIGVRYKLEKQGETWTLANYSNLYNYFKSHP